MNLNQVISSHCCGGPVLAMVILCLGLGFTMLGLSALTPGIVLISVGLLTEALCIYLSLSRCPEKA